MPAAVKRRHIQRLARFLEGDRPSPPNERGQREWGMHCPLHADNTRSASLNVDTGLWYCQVCEIGGPVDELMQRLPDEDFIPHGSGGKNVASFVDAPELGEKADLPKPPSEGAVAGWHSGLMSNGERLEALQERRGLNLDTLVRFQIGWDPRKRAYTIPIRDVKGQIADVRRYQLDAPDDRRKIWSVNGLGTPKLYPISMLDEEELVICEGEWDALLTIQNGFPAITRTGAAKVWRASWSALFDDKKVYICHDMDDAGQHGNRKVALALKGHARETKQIPLPYEVTPKHGKDLSDYWLEGYTPQDFKDLLNEGEAEVREDEVVEKELIDVGVLDSHGAELTGRKLRMRVTITGRRTRTYLTPEEVDYRCSQDAGAKCLICPMNEREGHMHRRIDSHDPILLELFDATNNQVADRLRALMGIQKCPKLVIDVQQHRAVEELYVRPSVEHSRSNLGGGDYTNRKVISVGRHDTLPNNTVEVVGSVYPHPKTQHNEFQAWEVLRTETSIDKFKVTPEFRRASVIFQSPRPLQKMAEIAKDLETNVTKIYGRTAMHVLFDLAWHSVLQFNFGDTLVHRGWLDVLVVGDTRTGKSEAADRMRDHYAAGEMISCESATFAGIVGGLQKVGGDEWEVTWGAIPLNDRRLVILDEISGLHAEGIAQMSSIRSSGLAELTKIRSERTLARTRLIWLGNPRNGRMSDYTYGVQAVPPLIGNPEDIARFDLAMSVRADEVDPEEINRAHDENTPHRFTSDLCRALLLWCWSRTADQVVWEPGAQDSVYQAALELGKVYTEVPPLVQAANVRIKVARIAVALAARTYSTDPTGECVVVRSMHVRDAVRLIHRLYGAEGFGYKELSAEAHADLAEAARKFDEAKEYLASRSSLAKFLRSQGQFRRQDMEDMMNLSREEATQVISDLWEYRMIRREGPNIKLQPLMHEILRAVAR